MTAKDYGHAITVLRAARGLSQSQLAERTGYSRAALCRLEAGERLASATLVSDCAQALCVSSLLVDALATPGHELARLKPETRQALGLELLDLLATRRAA